MSLVAGVDSSTQSTKILLCRAEDGAVVASASAPHPDGTECPPERWWEALTAAGRDLLRSVARVANGAHPSPRRAKTGSNFTARRMAQDYVHVYERLIRGREPKLRAVGD